MIRHPLRWGAIGLAALSISSAVAGAVGVLAAVVGAVAGALFGELLGRTRLRVVVLILGHAGAMGAVLALSGLVTRWAWLPELIGPATAITVDVVVRFFGLAFCLVSGLRSLGVRRRSAMALEVVALGGAVSVMFAAHRDAVIDRPLWLSDWAWRHGWDPANVLLAIGAAAVVVLAIILMTESERRLSLATFLTLPLLALLAVSVLGVSSLHEPQVDRDLGLTEEVEGDRSNPQEPDDANRGNQPSADRVPTLGPDSGATPARSGGLSDGGAVGGEEADAGSSRGEEPDRTEGTGQGREAPDGGMSEDGGGDRAAAEEPLDGDRGGAGPRDQRDRQGGGRPSEPGENDRPPSEGLDSRRDSGPSSSPAPVAVVILEDDYSPETQAYYFRQSAWSEYNGSRLVEARRADADLDVMRHYPTLRERVRQSPPEEGRTLVHGRVAILTDHAAPFALESPVAFSPLRNPNAARFRRAWRFESRALATPYRRLAGRALGDRRWAPELRAHYVAGPDDPRYERLAREIVSRIPAPLRDDPFTQAVAVKLWLDRELTYSTSERHAGQADPTAHMLFGNRVGYCVHFAHAAVYLWRALGIPARVGTGYQVPEDHRRGSTLMIRANDGHAWPELYVEGLGWVVLDIAAQRNLDPPAQPLDEDLQELLGEMAREDPPNPLDPPSNEPLWPTMWRDVAGASMVVFFGALVLLYLLKLWRRLLPRFDEARHLPRVAYRDALDRLYEAGFVRGHGETREQFAERLRDVTPAFVQMTAWHLAAKLGDPAGPPERRVEYRPDLWDAAMRSFRAQLRGAAPWTRRALGALNPISPFFVR